MVKDDKPNSATEPVFDYSNYSYGDQQADADLRLRAVRLSKRIDDAPADMPDDEFDLMVANLNTMRRKLEQGWTRYIVSVPRDWLVSTAPASIDWNEIGALDCVRADRIEDLRRAGIEARSPESVSGN